MHPGNKRNLAGFKKAGTFSPVSFPGGSQRGIYSFILIARVRTPLQAPRWLSSAPDPHPHPEGPSWIFSFWPELPRLPEGPSRNCGSSGEGPILPNRKQLWSCWLLLATVAGASTQLLPINRSEGEHSRTGFYIRTFSTGENTKIQRRGNDTPRVTRSMLPPGFNSCCLGPRHWLFIHTARCLIVPSLLPSSDWLSLPHPQNSLSQDRMTEVTETALIYRWRKCLQKVSGHSVSLGSVTTERVVDNCSDNNETK